MILDLPAIEHVLEPWKQAYSDSVPLSTGITAIHLLAMLFGGGLAIAADRTTLRLRGEKLAERRQHLIDVSEVHRPVLIALFVSLISGLAMLASDLETFVASPALWIKLGLVALLVINGVLLERTESALRRSADNDGSESLWSRLKFNAIASLVLWSATLVAGITLVNVA